MIATPKDKRHADLLHRLLVRAGLLCLAPVLVAVLRFGASQVIFCLVSALLWSLLEASIIYRVPLSAGCRKLPFILRLLAASCLDIQACWLLGSSEPKFTSSEAMGLNMNTLSIVLPCANESDFVLKTIKAVYEATPTEQLEEIIVVDDKSVPVISEDIDSADLESHRARILRHDDPQGLIRSKKHGADSAKGDIIVFLDCHVKPIQGWTQDLFSNIRENPKRIVVPTISSLDPDTWEESSSAGGRKMCLTWNADFYWCNGYPGPYVPIMSGGLLALSRYWWETTGGYDSKMQAWGGENLDQSLRTWLCGGEIVVAKRSRVAHMWRDPSKPKTVLHYSIPTEHVLRNRLRAATSWMGEWAKKVRSFPEFSAFNPGGQWELGTFENVDPYKDQLQCKDFKWYLDKFQDLYEAQGLLPKKVFNLRERTSQLCLHHELTYHSNQEGKMVLRPCNRFSEAQRFHAASAVHNHKDRCCSGIKLWDIDICLAATQVGNAPVAEMCFLFGESSNQWIQLSEGGQLQWRHGEGCIIAGDHAAADKEHTYKEHKAQIVRGSHCAAKIESVGGDSSKIRLVHGSDCLSIGEGQEWKQHGTPLLFLPCADGGAKQFFTIDHRYSEDSHQLKTSSGLCVDAANSEGPIAYECHKPEDDNRQQQFNAKIGSPLLWSARTDAGDRTMCIDPYVFTAKLVVCAASADGAKSGQGFQKHIVSPGEFQLKDMTTGSCLAPLEVGHETHLAAKPCIDEPEQRWSTNNHGNLINKGRNQCIDSGDGHTPLLYTCYPPGQNPKQSFTWHENGWIEIPHSWADNGRVRYLGKCIDTHPVEPLPLTVTSCGQVSEPTWEAIWDEVPMETQMYLDASKVRGNLRANS